MRKKSFWPGLLLIVMLLALLLLLPPRIGRVVRDVEQRRETAIKDAVLRSAFQCYAVEGVYPADMDYLEREYGLLIDHDRYIVSYECYASNRLPEVMVLKR